MHFIGTTVGLLFVLLMQSFTLAGDISSSLEQPDLNGKWLVESAVLRKQDRLGQVWTSVVTISSNSFAITNFLAPTKELRGKIHFHGKGSQEIDVTLDELDFSDVGEPVKIEPMTLKGILKVDGSDSITMAVNTSSSLERPIKFESTNSVLLLRLLRAPKGFVDFPKEIAIEVITVAGKPIKGAIAASHQSKRPLSADAEASWKYFGEKKTDATGIVNFPYAEPPRIIIEERAGLISFPKMTPSLLVDGRLKVMLVPLCKVSGKLICDELTASGQPLGWTNVYLEANGERVVHVSSAKGTFDFSAPAGEYDLVAYGGQVVQRKLRFSISPNQAEMALDPIALKPSPIVLLKGKPAPEISDAIGWSGKPVKLSELKGKYVLLDFWGYWCGPCVGAMPVFIELHEKFGEKGLAIVGVHVDSMGEVDSQEKLKERTSLFVAELWQGKELPFSNALVSGKPLEENQEQLGTLEMYGIEAFPTTILIDPQGNVVDKFHARDIDDATQKIEKLLKQLY